METSAEAFHIANVAIAGGPSEWCPQHEFVCRASASAGSSR